MKPLFKWTGGKGRLLAKYTDVNFFPDAEEFDTFVDLFAGSCTTVLWVAERYPDKKLVINDKNTELVTMYRHIADEWDEFIIYYHDYVSQFLQGTKEDRKQLYDYYKEVYAFEYVNMSPVQVSALLLVMLKTNFNGIWKSYFKWASRYSTPAGTMTYKTNTDLFNPQKLLDFRDILRRTTIYNESFEDVPIPNNSWIYADPPYRDSHSMYSDQFDDKLQVQLGEFLKGQNGLYAESNKEIGDGFWKNLYPDAHIHELEHKYTCGQGKAVVPVTEVLIKNYK